MKSKMVTELIKHCNKLLLERLSQEKLLSLFHLEMQALQGQSEYTFRSNMERDFADFQKAELGHDTNLRLAV